MLRVLSQKHILFRILVYFISSPRVSEPKNYFEELVLRENAAKLLARLIEKYFGFNLSNDNLKYINIKPHIFDSLCKSLVLLVDDFSPENFATIYAIMKVSER